MACGAGLAENPGTLRFVGPGSWKRSAALVDEFLNLLPEGCDAACERFDPVPGSFEFQ